MRERLKPLKPQQIRHSVGDRVVVLNDVNCHASLSRLPPHADFNGRKAMIQKAFCI